MIIIKMQGGLGNQLFQYALGKNLALKNNTTLKLDISSFENNPDRRYGLDFFNLKENFASSAEISSFKKNGIKKIIEKLKPYTSRAIIIEKFNYFDPDILKLKNDKYLIGYWQSEKYFKNIENIIRQEIVFNYEASEIFLGLSKQINSVNAISLHIRRGDYIKNKKFSKIFYALNLDYYNQAIELIAKQTAFPNFFIFSDDLSWVKDNLSLPYPHTLINDDKKLNDCEELMLMSLCKNNIIANSSFSWWGAWLNQNQNKIVIAPKKWFKDTSINTQDLLPINWIKL